MFRRQSAIFKDLYFGFPEDVAAGLKHVGILHVMVYWLVMLFNNTSEIQKWRITERLRSKS